MGNGREACAGGCALVDGARARRVPALGWPAPQRPARGERRAMNEAKCCKCGKPAAVVDYVHGEERAYCAACLANQRSAEQGLPIDPEAVRLGKPTNAAEHIAALEAGTLTQWRAEGNALRETPTPEWPEIEKSIVWEEKE